MRCLTRLTCCLLTTLLWSGLCSADPAIWQVKGKHNTLYLLGTIHMLQHDETLPDNVNQAYRSAEKLLMEVDMDDPDPSAVKALTLKLGTLPNGQTLMSKLDEATNRKLQAAANTLGFDANDLAPFRPWLAALTLEQLQLNKLGYAVDAGVEMQLTQQAMADHKPIQGLETLEQQLKVFASLNNKAQREYLEHTLMELDEAPTELEALSSAWRQGDDKELQKMLEQGFADDPKLFTKLTTARNKRWMVTLKPLLERGQDDYLVAVGALHLIGNDGLVNLLKRAGYTVTREPIN
ncbi:MAG: TraB/GumN family protein [Steroidobacteraceae bacterium]